MGASLRVREDISQAATAEASGGARLLIHRQFHSRFLPDDRDITVYLPPGYEEEAPRRYPVLYMHDGQNLFDPRTSFVPGRTWQVHTTADALIEAGEVEPLIIVGVANTGERRLAEYTHIRDGKMGGGEADKYGKLLMQELLPFIHANYRTLTGPQNTGLGGSSLGGLVSLYLGLKYTAVYGRLAVHSPSLWWNHENILAFVDDRHRMARPRIWLDVGDAEGKRTLADADRLDRRLRAKGWRTGIDLHYERVEGGTHDEAAWAERVGPMLRFLFPATGADRK
ncbi:alpha/beta hydrolase [Acidipila rosea]|uniref:Enterochelin esterase-like enzyme n=1 Tax=Acidipila rosea TaxID=768535 RepID=A0A4R1L9V4_9BACT|nr:alpha/beta hydrolase-fold protein [Acidipila rosea]MBW4043855.1 esterase family protein [Acidobacteriota bacterium]TCK74157.1 enterochelin esterase-like enzyme [Acidipila rosea]